VFRRSSPVCSSWTFALSVVRQLHNAIIHLMRCFFVTPANDSTCEVAYVALSAPYQPSA
jgi:hypothetical protein